MPRFKVVGTRRLYLDKRWYEPGDVYDGDPHPALLNVRPQDRHLVPLPATVKAAAKKRQGKPEKPEG